MRCIGLRAWLPFITFVLLRAVWCFDLAQAAGGRIAFRDNDDLAKSATWQMPNEASLALAFSDWLANIEAPLTIHERTMEALRTGLAEGRETLDVVVHSMSIAQPKLRELIELARSSTADVEEFDLNLWAEASGNSNFLRDHVGLYVARWLARNEYYDEALLLLRRLSVNRVVAPASLLFYRGLMEHQLLRRDECIETLQQLLEHEEALPRRFCTLAKLMLADIEPLEPDSLDEISRLMRDVRRRTGLYRSGKIVLGREQEVIDKLDKLIESLESQQTQPEGGQNNSSSPMQDSNNAGGQGDGEVARKQQTDGGNWGDLPPARRAAALAEMAKQMPPHYRSVIEEYFRQLATEKDR